MKKDYIREYIGDLTHIDGRTIAYQLITASDYLKAKEGFTQKKVDTFVDKHYDEYLLINQIMAIKQSCFLLRRTSYSCGSLSENLFELKLRLIAELENDYNYFFDDKFVENFTEEIE